MISGRKMVANWDCWESDGCDVGAVVPRAEDVLRVQSRW
jgi:hypothetical protein